MLQTWINNNKPQKETSKYITHGNINCYFTKLKPTAYTHLTIYHLNKTKYNLLSMSEKRLFYEKIQIKVILKNP